MVAYHMRLGALSLAGEAWLCWKTLCLGGSIKLCCVFVRAKKRDLLSYRTISQKLWQR